MSTVKANDLTNVTGGIPTVKSQQLIPTAWVNFNGTGTVAIRDSENVSSITDRSVGQFTINLTNALLNTNAAVLGTSHIGGASNFNRSAGCSMVTSSTAYFATWQSSTGDLYDVAVNSAVVMGGQA